MSFFEPDDRAPFPGADPRSPFDAIRRRDRRRRAAVVSALLAAALAASAGVIALVGPAEVLTSARQVLGSEAPAPSPEVVAVADRAFLTEEGRALLYRSRPTLATIDEVREACERDDGAGGSALGCFRLGVGIYVYHPPDPRVADAAVTTLAHEMLHAAYEELGAGEVLAVDDMLHAEIARVAADDPVHEQIEGSVGEHEELRETELFAYLGTQFFPEGGMAPELEAVYSRWIADRAALVGVYRAVGAVIDTAIADARAATEQLSAEEASNANTRAQWEADRAWHEQARALYNEHADQYNAMAPEERPRWTATWTATDGTTRTMPLGESLELRLREIEDYRAELDARAEALTAAEAAAATRRPEVEAQYADLLTLLDAAYPGREA